MAEKAGAVKPITACPIVLGPHEFRFAMKESGYYIYYCIWCLVQWQCGVKQVSDVSWATQQ